MPTRLPIVVAALALIGFAAVACSSDPTAQPGASNDLPVGHVHGVGVDPAGGSVLVASHTGLYRADGGVARRVGNSGADLMGFVVAGPGHFLASGHPDVATLVEQASSPHLGFIESRDGGATWTSVSLAGSADLHVMRIGPDRLWAYDAITQRLFSTTTLGVTWLPMTSPGDVIDLAPHPSDPLRLAALTTSGLSISDDGAQSWRGSEVPGFTMLSWTASGALIGINPDGDVFERVDDGTWELIGAVDAWPVVIGPGAAGELLVAGNEGEVFATDDGGRTWLPRASFTGPTPP